MAVARLVRLEQLRFLRETARKLRGVAPDAPGQVATELLKMAKEIEREADDLEVVQINGENSR